ncbi:hypothetical protein EJ05DRAFT_289481 [Pseudovirgaria hyperparasitica]|uniref:Uncharacterized protein n=1 Tax=Pseudovirgaria hyperparasitica TaxID=470096 RepID=A0A6A6WCL1_9PEZI|nr:uncharacterized protein EJ05DRAFT_289481 [Pseudovirgaria hyperparasitica]KAF2760572.1 hypothetical protein EJ05DRAFT_289481 [Pseudovirgaria hyperparasitica]
MSGLKPSRDCVHLIAGTCIYYTAAPILYAGTIFNTIRLTYQLAFTFKKKSQQDADGPERQAQRRRARLTKNLRAQLQEIEIEKLNARGMGNIKDHCPESEIWASVDGRSTVSMVGRVT